MAAGIFWFSSHNEGTLYYQSRVKAKSQVQGIAGAIEYTHSLRMNQITGKVDPKDVKAVLAQIESQKLYKAGLPLNWVATGPDNIGGRTRAILIDRNNNNILYAGGVSGGLFKSTNKGAFWNPVNDKQENLAVVSICQTSNGTIYYGTGEGQFAPSDNGSELSAIMGEGIFKSTDGTNFQQLANTKQFTRVNSMAADPVKNIVYAGTQQGLYYSENDGSTWKLLKSGSCREIKVASNGNVIAYVVPFVYRSTNGTDATSYVAGTGFNTNARTAIAISPQDPNYVYAFVAGAVSIVTTSGTVNVADGMVGLYQSKDGGITYSQVVGKETQYFAILSYLSLGSSQGTYDLVVGVHPRDKERVFMGGISWAEWSPLAGPRIVGNTFNSPLNPVGIHSDKHAIVFDTMSNPIIMYIGSDGGIAKTTNNEMTTYAAINLGYATTQFYGIAASTDGRVIGGTQDNNTIYIKKGGSNPQRGVSILGGDGFRSEISTIDPDVFFVESQNGNLARSFNSGGSASPFWDNRIEPSFVSASAPSGIFNTPMRLWENTTTLESRLFYAIGSQVWMAKNPINSGGGDSWFKIANLGTAAHIFETSKDGDHLFIGGPGRVYRVDGLNKANFDSSELDYFVGANKKYDKISDSLSFFDIRGSIPGGRTVTDIDVDQNNPNRVVVTLGNYGNPSYVFITQNALDPVPTWTSIQGNLPNFPVYDVEISIKDPNIIVLGTEFGVWATTNGQAASPTWVEQNNNLPRAAVYEIRQVEEKPWSGPKLYAGTHGRGIFETSSFLTGIRETTTSTYNKLSVYPNPASDFTMVKTNYLAKGSAKMLVYDIKGNLIESRNMVVSGNADDIRIETSDYTNGIYLLSIEQGSYSGKTKFIVTH